MTSILSTTLARAAHILRTNPAYIFGRFVVVRRIYAGYANIRNLFKRIDTILVGEHYFRFGGGCAFPTAVQRSDSLMSELPPAEHASRVRAQSVSLGIQLNTAAQSELMFAARKMPLRVAHRDREITFEELHASPTLRDDVAIATVCNAAKLPLIQRIAADAELISIASHVLGHQASSASVWMFWSISNRLTERERENKYQTVRFHYDVDGLSFVYANFYLTDVTLRSGAHVYISSTHKRKKLRHLFGSARLDDDAALADFGPERIIAVEGPAGTGFIEDSSCYHKATPPEIADRLMLQIRYK
jgi:hypothetical protein